LTLAETKSKYGGQKDSRCALLKRTAVGRGGLLAQKKNRCHGLVIVGVQARRPILHSATNTRAAELSRRHDHNSLTYDTNANRSPSLGLWDVMAETEQTQEIGGGETLARIDEACTANRAHVPV
jgi:hypothetical protein